jgi:ATP-dependent helicase/nuclease subunit A
MPARAKRAIQPLPPDQDQRLLVQRALDRNMLVEAAAGTGKTTSMVQRMVALLAGGACASIRTLAAVTFTRKAAAELRSRFRLALEVAAREASGEEKARLQRALSNVEQCFVGTIHSFCARLLRERPIEAAVDLEFREVEDEDDQRLRQEAWQEYTAVLFADPQQTGLEELAEVGLRVSDLRDAFVRFCDFPDVEEWPAPPRELPDLEEAARAVAEYAAHAQALSPRFPADPGTDTLMPNLERLVRYAAHVDDLTDPVELMEVLELFERACKLTQRAWMQDDRFTREQAKDELERWETFRDTVAAPLLQAWREYRYPVVMRALTAARERYDALRAKSGQLNYADLLMKAARLLRDKPHVRRYFATRYTHLLVDEFQDTDPIQAEVMLLLTADDAAETDWRRCRPRPGSLFVVGDPKQSIYRFRRADIVTYAQVKELIAREGQVVTLSANFRSLPEVIDWVNSVFAPDGRPLDGGEVLRFADRDSEESPAYVALQAAHPDGMRADLRGVLPLLVPPQYGNKEAVVEYEADRIARTIRDWLDTGATVLRRNGPGGVTPSDILIIARNTARLSVYAAKLQEYGIAHQVTGGAALNQVPELRLLHLCLQAVTQPDNPVALVAVLRSELFGISDVTLYRYKKAGGRFCYREEAPEGLSPADAAPLREALDRLRRYARWLDQFPPIAAVERIIGDLGLNARAAARPGGDVSAGSLAKAVEVLRGGQPEAWAVAQLVEDLGRLVEAEVTHDGLSARSADVPAVRVMNLHKAKGLEAPIVFLADPHGEAEHAVPLHVDRAGGRVLGYLAISRQTYQYVSEVLALPPGWAEKVAREQRFSRAEALRLRYVAATRAGAAVIVTQRTGTGSANARNPWGAFAPSLAGHREVPDPGEQSPPPGKAAQVSADEAAQARGTIAQRMARIQSPTYAAEAAKQYSLAAWPSGQDAAAGRGDEGEHGVERGAALHLLLELAMRNPEASLARFAPTALAEQGLDPAAAAAVVAQAEAVMRSEVWRRAQQSERRLVEAPFAVMLGEGETPRPTLVRGAMDLVFREQDGWVLVDYKTDNVTATSLQTLAARYAPQVRLYAKAWAKCTGEPVKEMGLYFVRADAFVRVDPEPQHFLCCP